MDEHCVVHKKHNKKTARLYINAFMNKQRTKRIRENAATKINRFVKKRLLQRVDVEKIPAIVKSQHMYNPDIKFFFYSGSANAVPGKGARETIPDAAVEEYKESLKDFPEFRKMLTNFGEGRFRLDGLEWNTVEHYYQGSKFKLNHPDFYKSFSANSGNELSKDPNMAKAYGGKTGKFRNKQVRDRSIQVDPDFFSGRGNQEMYDAQFAKFTQNDRMKQVLLATKDAQLFHTMPRSSVSIPFDNLVYIRDLIKNHRI
jgi:predicted NAD-dependent protein-ADP-ribosyltransferase YbiA (DUF1768 family)